MSDEPELLFGQTMPLWHRFQHWRYGHSWRPLILGDYRARTCRWCDAREEPKDGKWVRVKWASQTGK